MSEHTPDVRVANHGTLFLFTPLTDAASAWIAEHIPEDAQWLGRSLVVEHRYAMDVAKGMTGDGLVLQ